MMLASRLALACGLLLGAATAHAQEASGQAELLFRQGRDLMAAGKLAEACAAFEASEKLEPAVTTLLNLGACREKNGQLATAYGAYASAERLARQASDANSRQLDRVASEHVARIEPHVPKLTIRVADRVDGLEIRRGGEVVDPATWGQPIAIDGGSFELTARAPGHVAWTKKVTLARQDDEREVNVPPLAGAPEPREVHEAHEAPPPPPPPPPPPRRPSRALPLAFAGGAVATLGGAIGFELWAESTYDQSKKEPVVTTQDSLWQSANTKRHVAQAFAGGSVACAAVAVWLYLRGGSTAPVATAHSGGGSIGIAGVF